MIGKSIFGTEDEKHSETAILESIEPLLNHPSCTIPENYFSYAMSREAHREKSRSKLAITSTTTIPIVSRKLLTIERWDGRTVMSYEAKQLLFEQHYKDTSATEMVHNHTKSFQKHLLNPVSSRKIVDRLQFRQRKRLNTVFIEGTLLDEMFGIFTYLCFDASTFSILINIQHPYVSRYEGVNYE